MNTFTIQPSKDYNTGEYYLTISIQAYYHQDYTTFGTEGHPDFLNYLKNQFNNINVELLKSSMKELQNVLEVDLCEIKNIYKNSNLTVCVVPRAKDENSYHVNQKLFRKVVSDVLDKLNGYSNGTSFILRHTNTRTTHLDRSGYGGDGDRPYAGITKNTCTISTLVKDKDILLIDDIYTSGVNIDEDAIQALLDNGANNVYFYAVGKTYRGQRLAYIRENNSDDDLPF